MANAVVEIVEVDSVLLAVTAARVKREDIASAMGACFGRVYDWLGSNTDTRYPGNRVVSISAIPAPDFLAWPRTIMTGLLQSAGH